MASTDSNKPLTALQVKNHRSGTLSDAHPNRGLRLVANTNGSRTWIYRYRTGKKLKQIKLGDFPTMGLSDARSALGQKKAERAGGADPQAAKQAARAIEKTTAQRDKAEAKQAEHGALTVRRMITQYIDDELAVSRTEKGTLETQRLLLHDLGDLANRTVESLTTAELHNHISVIRKRAPSIADDWRREVKAAWNCALNAGRVMAPCLLNSRTGGKIKAGRRDRVLSDVELKQLIPFIRENFNPIARDVILISLYTGSRTGEVIGIHDKELTTEDDGVWLNIPGERMKSRKPHRIPLTGVALKIIESRAGKGFLFPSSTKGKHAQQKVLSVETYTFRKTRAKRHNTRPLSPIEDYAPHDFRRTARTMLAKMGCPFEVGEAILSHALPGVSAVYNLHEYDNEKRAWLKKLERHINGVLR